MRYLLMVLMLIAAAQVTASGVFDVIESIAERAEEASVSSEVEVIELFRAETPEELEAALTDGYPMPWLEEILNDESIPEEDRYWLDCRMRAVIAQDLHIFYDKKGNPVHVEAAWIAPGEDYWREYVMIRPILPHEERDNQSEDQNDTVETLSMSYIDYPEEEIREPFSENSPTLMSDPPGDILNLYSEKVGELAVVNRSVVLSRDASIGAVQSGGNEHPSNWDRTPYACILYPDGSFIEHPFDATGTYKAAVSADGSTIVFICIHMAYPENEDDVVDAWVFNNEGHVIHRITPPEQFYGTYLPQISPDGKYCIYTLLSGNGLLMNCRTGTIYRIFEPLADASIRNRRLSSNTLKYDATGHYLCLGGFSGGAVVNLDNLNTVWEGLMSETEYNFSIVRCSGRASRIVCTTRQRVQPDFNYTYSVYQDGVLLHSSVGNDSGQQEMIISPGGTFLLSKEKDIHRIDETSLPILLQIIRGGE